MTTMSDLPILVIERDGYQTKRVTIRPPFGDPVDITSICLAVSVLLEAKSAPVVRLDLFGNAAILDRAEAPDDA